MEVRSWLPPMFQNLVLDHVVLVTSFSGSLPVLPAPLIDGAASFPHIDCWNVSLEWLLLPLASSSRIASYTGSSSSPLVHMWCSLPCHIWSQPTDC